MLQREIDSPFWKWPGGIVAPLVLVVSAIGIWIAQEVTVGRRWGIGMNAEISGRVQVNVGELPPHAGRMPMTLHGRDATMYAWCMIAVAVIAHFRFFWTNTPRLCPYAPLGEYSGIALFVIPLWRLIFSQCINFI